ncbi:porin family protein [Rickettsiaceae bacterium]|nr:porin family protein [Rickettsiaceae bacterium]
MKKILLTAATATILASSSAYAMEDMFYVKANVGWSKLSKINSAKSKNDVFFGVGAGYHVMDNVRVDLTFDHFVDPVHKAGTVKVKGDINTLMVNGFVDLFDIDVAKIFVGAGVGAGQVKAKVTNSADSTQNKTAKQKTNLAFAGYLGASYEFTPGVTGDLTYSYRDMGKTKKTDSLPALHYKGHHVGFGVRFDI